MGLLGGSDARINATFTATDHATPTIKALRGEITKFGSNTGGPLGGLIKGLGGLNLSMVGAVVAGGAMVGAFVDVARAGAEAQMVDDKLKQSVEDNVGAYGLYADAINKTVDAGVALAFSADDQKNALAQLLPRTHDVGKATQLLSLSMDAARFKGLDLVDTAMALGKVYSGNVQSAKRLGFVIDKGATSQQALAQIQAAVAGQAATYAKTATGQWQAIDDRVIQLKQDIGERLLPVEQAALTALDGLINPQAPDLGPLQSLIDKNNALAAATGNVNAAQNDMLAGVGVNANNILNFMLQADQALVQGNTNAELSAIALTKYGNAIGVTTDQLKNYILSAEADGLTTDQIIAQLKTLAAAQQQHARQLQIDAANTDAAAASVDRLSGSQARYQAQLDAFAHRPGANLSMIGMPKKQTVEQQAEGIGKAFSGGIEAGLKANVNAVAAAALALQYAVKHPLAILNGKGGFGWLTGKLQSDGLQRGLNSKKPEVRAAAEAEAALIRNALAGMPTFVWGSKAAADYLAGLRSQGLMRSPYGWGPAFVGNPFGQYPTGGGGGGGGGHTPSSGGGHHGSGNNRNASLAPMGGETHIHVHIDGREVADVVNRRLGLGWASSGTGSRN